MTWTQFMDMHSGGGQKLDWPYIYIEAPEAEAKRVFYAKFGRNPERVTCTCCGEDYSITESETLMESTASQRNLPWIEDERGWIPGGRNSKRPADYRKGRYLEIGEVVPPGYRIGERYLSRNDAISLEEYVASGDAKLIYASEITDADRRADVPPEGYVWA